MFSDLGYSYRVSKEHFMISLCQALKYKEMAKPIFFVKLVYGHIDIFISQYGQVCRKVYFRIVI